MIETPSHTQIKICGVTSVEDAVAVAAAGADQIGLNFYPTSPRFVPGEIALSICRAIPEGVMKVGVFVNSPIDEVLERADFVGLDSIQLHGDESPAYVAELRRSTDRFLIRAFSSDSIKRSEIIGTEADAILIDSPHSGEYGGTGKAFDWGNIRGWFGMRTNLYLAGGLAADNVGAAIRTLRPNVVDACSRLESVKGKKDISKVKAFVREVRAAL